jgi:hypothetical protein
MNAKKIIGFSLGLLCLSAGAGVVLAQDSAPGVNGPPKVLVIQREYLKPGKGGSLHERSESAFVRAMNAAKWPTNYIGMNSLSGPSRALFFIPYASFAAWEKDNQATEHNATLAGAMDRAALADGELLSSYDSSVWTFNEEDSLNSDGGLADQHYMEITSFKIRPGHRKEWEDLVKMAKSGYAKVPNMHWATFESMYGADNGGVYLVVTSMKSLSEADAEDGQSKQFMEAMGEGGMKKFSELEASCVEKVQTNLFQFDPKMSYPPAEWVKANPDFWKPKMAAPMKKEAAKPEQ